MLSLLYILAAIIYGIVLIVVTSKAYRWGLKRWAKPKAYLAGLGGFLLIYLPVFWDHIPTLIAHQYYCSNEAGLTVNKTSERWKQENSDIARQLPLRNIAISEDGKRVLNERFREITEKRQIGLLPVAIYKFRVIDAVTDEVMLTQVGVGSGYGNSAIGTFGWRSFKWWLSLPPCWGEGRPDMKEYGRLASDFRDLRE